MVPNRAVAAPARTADGFRNIEEIRPGELIYSRDEHDAAAPAELKRVEETFAGFAGIFRLHFTGGQTIDTTAEHPLFAVGVGWIEAWKLAPGTQVLCADGSTVTLEAIVDTGEWLPVFNLRIADHHTYFVGCDEWGFSVWAHNACINVYEYDLIIGPHLSVKVTVGDKVVWTHQIPVAGPAVGKPKKPGISPSRAKVEPFTPGIWGGEQWIDRQGTIEVSDTAGRTAQAFQAAELLRPDTGVYQVNANDCLTHVVDVLRAAGQPLPAPAGNTDHVKALLRLLGGE